MRAGLATIRKARRLTVASSFHPQTKYKLKSTPGGLWDRNLRVWHYPATPASAGNLDRQFGDELEWSDEASSLLEQWRQVVEAGREICATYASGTPVLLDGHCPPPELWRHQTAGVAYAEKVHGCLWHIGMGAGKTLMALTLIQRIGGPVLVVCPKAVLPTWKREAERHYGDRIEIVNPSSGSVASRAREIRQAMQRSAVRRERPFVAVVNYESVWRTPLDELVLETPWSMVICDEIHRIKAPGGKASNFMAKLADRVPRRLGLSGTPCPHSPLDAYGVFRFLDAGIYGTSFVRFRGRYAVMGGYEGREVVGYQREDEFNARFYSISFRVDRDVLDLPPEHHVYRTLELPPAAMKTYRQLERTFVADLESGVLMANHALARLLRLQQLTSGFLPYEDDTGVVAGLERIHDVRRDALAEILDEMPPDEPVVIFCRFKQDLEDVHGAAESVGRGSLELSGSRDELAEWRSGGPPVLAVQI